MIESKKMSLLIILVIYIISIGLGVGAFILVENYFNNLLLSFFIADLACFVGVYLLSLIFKNSSIYDPYWSLIPFLIYIGFLCYSELSVLNVIVLVCFGLWSMRLTYNWITTFSNLKWEDFRYRNFKKNFPRAFQLINFFGIMLFPTVMTFLTTIPLYYFVQKEANLVYSIIGSIIILLGVFLEHFSDKQLKEFKRSENKEKPYIETGLWKYSRHPNYLGEILIWVGVFVCSLNNFNYLSVVGVICVTAMFIFISIPLMENNLIKNKEGYLDYKKQVSMLLLWRKKDD